LTRESLSSAWERRGGELIVFVGGGEDAYRRSLPILSVPGRASFYLDRPVPLGGK